MALDVPRRYLGMLYIFDNIDAALIAVLFRRLAKRSPVRCIVLGAASREYHEPAKGLRTETEFATVDVSEAVEPDAVTTQVMPLI